MPCVWSMLGCGGNFSLLCKLDLESGERERDMGRGCGMLRRLGNFCLNAALKAEPHESTLSASERAVSGRESAATPANGELRHSKASPSEMLPFGHARSFNLLAGGGRRPCIDPVKPRTRRAGAFGKGWWWC